MLCMTDQSESCSCCIAGMAQLYAFSRVPLREEPTSHDHHMTPYLLPLNNQCKRVINVIDLTVGTSQRILVVSYLL